MRLIITVCSFLVFQSFGQIPGDNFHQFDSLKKISQLVAEGHHIEFWFDEIPTVFGKVSSGYRYENKELHLRLGDGKETRTVVYLNSQNLDSVRYYLTDSIITRMELNSYDSLGRRIYYYQNRIINYKISETYNIDYYLPDSVSIGTQKLHLEHQKLIEQKKHFYVLYHLIDSMGRTQYLLSVDEFGDTASYDQYIHFPGYYQIRNVKNSNQYCDEMVVSDSVFSSPCYNKILVTFLHDKFIPTELFFQEILTEYWPLLEHCECQKAQLILATADKKYSMQIYMIYGDRYIGATSLPANKDGYWEGIISLDIFY